MNNNGLPCSIWEAYNHDEVPYLSTVVVQKEVTGSAMEQLMEQLVAQAWGLA